MNAFSGNRRSSRAFLSWAWFCGLLSLLWADGSRSRAADNDAVPQAEYGAVHEIFSKHCLDCHSSVEPEGKLVLESFATLMRGGESGAALVPGRSDDSLVVKLIEGATERDGKQRIMPPGRRKKLAREEIALVRRWIDQGAPGSDGAPRPRLQGTIPTIQPTTPPRRPVYSVAYSSGAKLIAIGRYGEVELFSGETRGWIRTLRGNRGSVNGLVFSPDGAHLFAAGGEAGLSGEIRQWKTADASLVRVFEGHKDAVYSVALSPDGQTLASGGYDPQVKLWNVESGSERKTLTGHNGAIFDLAFRPDGLILASASSDRTVKLWDVKTGERRDTLSQSLKEVNALAFSPDGTRLYAAGADNRIRIWEISEKALETSNPLLQSRFAHEGAILRIAISADGRSLLSSASDQTVKAWNLPDLKERLLLEPQPDWVAALAFFGEDKSTVVGRLDGSLQFYNAETGAALPPPKMELARSEPRGVQRGMTVKMKLIGANLTDLTEVTAADPRLKIELLQSSEAKSNEAWIHLTAPADLPRGAYPIWARAAQRESSRISVHVEDLAQLALPQRQERILVHELGSLPVSLWSTHEKSGDSEEFTFEAQAGQALLFEVAANRLGSQSDILLTLAEAGGKVLASSTGFGRRDPLIFHSFTAAGRYVLRVTELVLAGSAEHFYRLSIGAFPYVTGCFPMSVPVGQDTEVELIGYNLPEHRTVTVHPAKPGEMALALEETYRSRQEFKLIASTMEEAIESEPNDNWASATPMRLPGAAGGRVWGAIRAGDADCFRIQAKAGERWVIETSAAQRGSPVDTKLEILNSGGQLVERLWLQSVRDSAVTFRGIDSDTTDCRVVNWEEMDLNQFLYLQGEVVKLFRAPQGPDSGFLFYSSNGKRRCYLGTSPSAHAVDEPCYIVEPHPPGARLASNGLPVFPVHYVNDDDSDRRAGSDSKIDFTAPADGTYFIRVTDARGMHGEDFAYRLMGRRADPDFKVQLRGQNMTVGAGSGQSFTVEAERQDGFEGEIRVSISHLPRGFSASTPLLIQAGHTDAKGTIYANLDAPKPSPGDWARVEVTASAVVDGNAVVKAANNFGTVQLGAQPRLFVILEPDSESATPKEAANRLVQVSDPPPRRGGEDPCVALTIAPGETIPAWLRVRRNGHDDLINFTVENLPHGVIVDNIGLNGVLIPKGQDERQIFITAAPWVPETDRLCYALESQAGRQTSRPVLLQVRPKHGSRLSRQ